MDVADQRAMPRTQLDSYHSLRDKSHNSRGTTSIHHDTKTTSIEPDGKRWRGVTTHVYASVQVDCERDGTQSLEAELSGALAEEHHNQD